MEGTLLSFVAKKYSRPRCCCCGRCQKFDLTLFISLVSGAYTAGDSQDPQDPLLVVSLKVSDGGALCGVSAVHSSATWPRPSTAALRAGRRAGEGQGQGAARAWEAP